MSHLRISDMAEQNKPCEKALQFGITSLSDPELLAVILRSGSRDTNAIHLSEQILTLHPVHKGLTGLNYLSADELIQLPGVGQVKAVQILAVSELSRRIAREKTRGHVRMNDPATIADYYREEVRYLQRERVYALFFNTAGMLLRERMISEGTVDRALISTREIYREALRCDSTGIVILHNHPSGDCEPSKTDLTLTGQIYNAGQLIGIPLLDHIIIGGSSYVSFAERGFMHEIQS